MRFVPVTEQKTLGYLMKTSSRAVVDKIKPLLYLLLLLFLLLLFVLLLLQLFLLIQTLLWCCGGSHLLPSDCRHFIRWDISVHTGTFATSDEHWFISRVGVGVTDLGWVRSQFEVLRVVSSIPNWRMNGLIFIQAHLSPIGWIKTSDRSVTYHLPTWWPIETQFCSPTNFHW